MSVRDFTIKLSGIQPGSNVGILDAPKKQVIVAFHSPFSCADIVVADKKMRIDLSPAESFAVVSFTTGLFERFFRRQHRLMFRVRKKLWKPLEIRLTVDSPLIEYRIVQISDDIFDEKRPYQAHQIRSYA
jgi:hypothetical protein